MVVWLNEYEDVFRIRTMHGGPARVVHRTSLRMSPFDDEPHVHIRSEETSSSEEEYEIRLQFPSVQQARSGVTMTRDAPPLRRSARATKGKHSNPYGLPKPVK